MARDTLIGGALWEEYSSEVQRRMNDPVNMGEITQEEADKESKQLIIADFGAESCGDAVRLYWLIDPKNDVIVKSRFKSFGCGTAIASSDMMAELCMEKNGGRGSENYQHRRRKSVARRPGYPGGTGAKNALFGYGV